MGICDEPNRASGMRSRRDEESAVCSSYKASSKAVAHEDFAQTSGTACYHHEVAAHGRYGHLTFTADY